MNYLTENFTEEEFTRSQTAVRNGIDNKIPNQVVRNNIIWFCKSFLEPIRSAAREVKPNAFVLLSSGFRCLAVNRRVGSSDTSDHVANAQNAAADLTIHGLTLEDAFDLIIELRKKGKIPQWNQLVWEFGDWIHLGWRKVDPKGEIFSLTRREDGSLQKTYITKAPRKA